MATLAGETVVIIGGSSGIGYSLAILSILNQASRVIIASTNPQRLAIAAKQLAIDLKGRNVDVGDRIEAKVMDITQQQNEKQFFEEVGEIDHLVITAQSESLDLVQPLKGMDLEKIKSNDPFNRRFFSHACAIQAAKIKSHGSVTLSIGTVLVKPNPYWTILGALAGCIDGWTRALAVELAPIRVNVISPGLVKTERWDSMPEEHRNEMFKNATEKLLVRHVAEPMEVAEAYLFVLKCKYVTGTRIEVDGGYRLA
ncbi:NAD-binding protein [Atractiella rhizophila]|nr:NAD-binding protein [Atractiella rhizophila]